MAGLLISAIAAIPDDYQGRMSRVSLSKAMFSSTRGDWETPAQLFYFLQREFAFDLDACTVAGTAKCSRFLDPQLIDALNVDWSDRGSVIWCNPPYGRKIGAWIRKAVEASMCGATVVCLLPARTDTSWWHDYCMLGEIRFLRGQLHFDNGPNPAPFPSALVIFRSNSIRRLEFSLQESLGPV